MIFRISANTRALIPVFALLVLSVPASAGEAVMETLVVTASRLGAPLAGETTSTSLVEEDTLQLVGAVHINEALARLSGVWVSRGNGQEHLTAIRSPVLTGAGGCGSFLLAQDGIALRAAGFCNVNALIESQSETAGRIEVIKGPGTALHGGGAMHGMINIISPDFEEGMRRISAEAGPHSYLRMKGSFSSKNLRGDFSTATDGGWKQDSGFDQQKASLQWRTRAGSHDLVLRARLTNLNQETAGFVRGTDAYTDASLRRSNPNPEAYRDLGSARVSAHFRRTGETWKTAFTPYLRYSRMDFLQHFLPGQPEEKNAHAGLGIQALWQRDFAQHQLAFGFDFEAGSGSLEETQNGPAEGSDFLVAVIPAGRHYDYEVQAGFLAAFVRSSLSPAPGTRINLGLRLEQMSYRYDNLMRSGRTREDGTECGFGGCRFSRPDDRKDSFTNISPKLSLTQEIGWGSLYARLAEGYRAPEATELYRLQNNQSVSQIDSESIRALEVGWRGELARFWLDAAAYSMVKDNVIFRDSDRNNVDNGKTRHQGLELTLFWSPLDNLDLALTGSLAEHTYDDDRVLGGVNINGREIDTAPRELANLRLGWNPVEAVRLELEWVHLGDYASSPQHDHRYPGHDLVNLRTRADFGQGLSLFGRITNLTDTRYAERADFAFGGERYFVGEERSLYLGMEASW